MIGAALTRLREAAGDRWIRACDSARYAETWESVHEVNHARRLLALADAALDGYRWLWTLAAGVR